MLEAKKKRPIGFARWKKSDADPLGLQAQCSQWLAENKNALDEYNRRIESRGTFSDGLRRF